MGDRGNIYIQPWQPESALLAPEPGVYLYTHWSGSELEDTLRLALKRGEDRWGDSAYLTRIIFCEMVKGQEDENTGFGISTTRVDNEHPIFVVDDKRGLVFRVVEGREQVELPAGRGVTYQHFIDGKTPGVQ